MSKDEHVGKDVSAGLVAGRCKVDVPLWLAALISQLEGKIW